MQTLCRISTLATFIVLGACAGPNTAVTPDKTANLTVQDNSACLREADGRVAGAGAHCAVFSHSYSSDDIGRTGATTTGAALRLLDPAITVR